MDPITLALIASLSAITGSLSIVFKVLRSLFSKDKDVRIKLQTKDGTSIEITGDVTDPQKIENLIETLNLINSAESESPKEIKIEL